jgi:hypothetical protein
MLGMKFDAKSFDGCPFCTPKSRALETVFLTEFLRQLLELKAFNSHKATYDIHHKDEGNPTGSIHLVKSLSAPIAIQ